MKIGIVTLYYNNYNYGGVLQAYALYKCLADKSAVSKQITYKKSVDNSLTGRIHRALGNGLLYVVKKVIGQLNSKKHDIPVDDMEISIRRASFHHFMYEIIAHTEKIYNQDNICECMDDFDVFITGSDQVWNFAWYDSNYFLDFVDGAKKKKISYAASFSMKELSDEQKQIVAKSLRDYKAISVREQDAVAILKELTDKPVAYVVDPTLLLSREDWDEVCAERVVAEQYVFGYFLGTNIEAVRMAKSFAHKRNLKFVMIPFAAGRYTFNEDDLADVRIVDASPEKFLSIIKHAEYVFTDSFHAVVFSFIYQRQFFVFNRDKNGTMSSRITSITELFEMKERFCSSEEKQTLTYLENMCAIDYTRTFEKFNNLRRKSFEYIENNILRQ